MENGDLTREAKIKSVQRVGEAVELKKTATAEEKEEYYKGLTDYWVEREENKKRIRDIQESNKLMRNYTKEDLLQIADTMIETSSKTDEILGEVQDRKITKIEGNQLTVTIRTKDNKEIIRIYNMDLDFDKMTNITFSKEARIASPMRVGSAVEVKNIEGNDKKEEYYDKIPDFWDMSDEQIKEEK